MKYLLLLSLLLFSASCSKKKEELKSPCVSINQNDSLFILSQSSNLDVIENPCDVRFNPNFSWMNRVS